MDNRTSARLLIALLSAELFSKELDAELIHKIDEEAIKEIFTVAKLHDLAHIAGDALSKAGLLKGEAVKVFQKWQYLAVYRYQRSLYELSALQQLFCEAKIAYMPLKGTVLREYYPDPVMRTSVDIDILVHPEDLERAKALLLEKLHYTLEVEGPHDVGFFAPSELHVELHYALCDDNDKRTAALGDPWAHSRLKEGSEYEYEMSNAYFYAYAMAHAAKHFYMGGCGIRPFMDIVVMREKMPFDEKELQAFYEKADLAPFAAYAEKLAAYWFMGQESDETVDFMEDYLLSGGAYGSMEGYIISVQGDKSGAYYMLRKIFLPWRGMKEQYPILKKCPLLLPFCHLARWCAILFSKRRKSAAIQMRASRNLDREETRRILALQKKLHLD